jgi:uncharacterized protein (DUF58 family)
MSTRPTDTLDRGTAPWLFASALATTAPHVEHQPVWLSVLAIAIFAWAGWLLAAAEEGACYGLRLPGQEIAADSGEAHRHRCLEALALFPA